MGVTVGRGFGIEAAVPAEIVKQVASEAETLGYSSFWVNHPPGSDGLASLAAAASVTERIKLGVGVIPLDRHPPDQIIATTVRHGLPMDRLWLGVGSGGDQRGLDRVRRGIDDLRTGTTASVIISALGPKMTRLAGEAADGVLFNWFTPDFENQAGQQVRAAVSQSDRSQPLIMAYVRCGLLPQAQEKLVERSARYGGIPQYARHFTRMGVSAIDTCVSGTTAEELQAGIARHADVLDEVIVRAITADDSAESLLELLRACAPRSI
jgi:alkanesulfonate monooxygenase SsuD/methylene tetrahydromethanopterin reductase-like flavin-dependent oxidoreductase (luciferase family)